MKRHLPVLALALLLSPLAAQSPGKASPLLVSAAASLTDVLSALRPEAEKAIGLPIQFNFGGSGSLRKQIEEGAPVDVFFPAAAEDMDRLESGKYLAAGTRADLLSNSLVLVGDPAVPPVRSTEELARLLASAKVLAVGNPDSVPAGRYATQALKALGLRSAVEGRLALGGSVREVLQFVQSGSAPLGIVFLTDAMSVRTGNPIAVLYRFTASSLASPVVYPVAVLAASRNLKAAVAFIAFLTTPAARQAFEREGFTFP
jgi:molybdate transport system substrate-binding protein